MTYEEWNANATPMALARELIGPGACIPCDDPKNPTHADVLQEAARRAKPRAAPPVDVRPSYYVPAKYKTAK
jgi:hypothetical protein